MSVSLRDLQVFLAVVRAGSFGGGGAELGLRQPTVSERITRLERQIGVGAADGLWAADGRMWLAEAHRGIRLAGGPSITDLLRNRFSHRGRSRDPVW